MRSFYSILITFLIVLYAPAVAHSQNDTPPLETLFQFDIGLLGTSFNYEQPLLKNVSLRLDLGMEFGVFGSRFSNRNINLGINNRLGLEARYYIGRDRRHRLSRVMDANSGYYMALLTTYRDVSVLTPLYESIFYNGLGLSAVVGYKRKLGRRVFFESHIGGGYLWGMDRLRFNGIYGTKPEFTLRLGYIFGR